MQTNREHPEFRQSAWRGMRNTLLIALGLLVAVGLLALFGNREVVQQSMKSATSVSAPALMAMLGLALLNFFLRGIRWHYMTRRTGINARAGHSMQVYVAGFSMGVTPARLGEMIRIFFMKRDLGTSYARGFSVLFADRLGDLFALFILALLAAASQATSPGTRLLVAGTVAVGIFLLMSRPVVLMQLVTTLHSLLPVARRGFAAIRRSLRLGIPLYQPRAFTIALTLGTAAWLAEGIGFHVALTAMGASIMPFQAWSIYATATLVGALLFLPGGLGGFEATALILLLPLGIDTPTAIASIALIRLCTLWFSVLVGWLVLVPLLAGLRGR